ncbi:hypothetical protein ABNN70_00510 [Sporolactobacillus sp. Y61]|jgi:hypothetical protein|uniref:Uncharacterized protein n=1 Tax=Sporolactobacillus sp. Y61 TaxID=3160863 RepID=A0AAU8IFR3_9BACL|nr:hypothetical protein [Sporolactobacillus sp. THM19-2]RYL87518.1 hypothetical protein EWH91_12890 [Sporolactobacillus sp. THM19-2]
MKKIDWFLSLFLIIMGLTCLFFSANAFGHESLLAFGRTFVRACMWVACPVVVIGGLYLWFHYRNKR